MATEDETRITLKNSGGAGSLPYPGSASQTVNGKMVFIKTYGCQMNVYDSERMVEAAGMAGYAATSVSQEADLIILNTCHIRERAVEKIYSELGRLRQIQNARRAEGKETVIAVAGCVAQAEGEEIARRVPVVDLVFGPQSYHRLPTLLARRAETGKTVVDIAFPAAEKFELPMAAKAPVSAFLTVQEGCDKFCTFCVVPYTRGAEFSRPVAQIKAEAERLVDRGAREITLLGQNVNAYRGAGPDGHPWTLARLLVELSRLPGLARLRYTTSHPNDMTPDLIDAHARLDKLMPYLHLPFQAGSDRILRAMNRKHSVASYLDIVAELRRVCPGIALSTDIIVGFPGETESDFEETLAVVKTVRFAQAYSFKYSIRPGTPAADKPNQVPEDAKADRLARLQAELRQHQLAFNRSMTGHSIPVLWEGEGRMEGQVSGRSPYLQPVHAAGDVSLVGTITPVSITSAGPNSLRGVIKF